MFGSGSRTPIAITLLVKNPKQKQKKATIHYHDIGDYLSREEKLTRLAEISSGEKKQVYEELHPKDTSDWIVKRNERWKDFIEIGGKDVRSDSSDLSFFTGVYSRGLATARDAWCYNSNPRVLSTNCQGLIEFYEEHRVRLKEKNQTVKLESLLTYDSKRITWNRGLKNDLSKNREIRFQPSNMRVGIYRPFFKQFVYFARELNDMVYRLPVMFPTEETKTFAICVQSPGGRQDFSCLLVDELPDLHIIGDVQCFPLNFFVSADSSGLELFHKQGDDEFERHQGISDRLLRCVQQKYSTVVTSDDIFYYVYGFLHSLEYRQTFANDLKKSLPRIPLVEDADQFWAFSKAGRQLGDLHVNYESVPPYPKVMVSGADLGNYRVEKMRFPAKGKKDTIHVNSLITVSEIPAKAYEYVVNGKSAIEWIMDRYQVTTHKESGITNDPNDWATEVGNPRYILDLLLSIINVSVQTVDIVASLPKVKFD